MIYLNSAINCIGNVVYYIVSLTSIEIHNTVFLNRYKYKNLKLIDYTKYISYSLKNNSIVIIYYKKYLLYRKFLKKYFPKKII